MLCLFMIQTAIKSLPKETPGNSFLKITTPRFIETNSDI